MANQPILFPETLRAMSIHFPFAWAIVHGEKDFEYRSRATKYRGIFLIHAGGSKDSDELIDEFKIPKDQIVRKAIIGAAAIVDCLLDEEFGGYIYELDNPIAFETPIPAIGQQSIFWPASTPERIEAFNQAWLQIPKYLLGVTIQDGIVTLTAEKESLEVFQDGVWQSFEPRIKDGYIELAEAELDALINELPDDEDLEEDS